MKQNIFITGFSGSGKTATGKEVARRLGWRFVDTDEDIVRAAGKSIEAIFAQDGEPAFRDLEHRCLSTACEGERQVVSTGGGIVVDQRNRELMQRSGVVVSLEARPETIYRRLADQGRESGEREARPMLGRDGGLDRIRTLKSERQPSYALGQWTVHTDRFSPDQAADEVIRGFRMIAKQSAAGGNQADTDLAATVRTPGGDYPVWVGWGILGDLGVHVRRVLDPGTAYVVADEGSYKHGRHAQLSMESAGIATHLFVAPHGEVHKNLRTVRHMYDWLVERRAERGHMIVAVGGGVIGDMAGFVAATYLRGLPFAQVPTTLLSVVDASIGGKVGVDLPEGKNLVGAFYQPRLVLADVETLQTLPRRELASGWAEAVKAGLILDEELFRTFERQGEDIRSLDREVAGGVIRRAVAIKAGVVSQDERESAGARMLLNYGHTVGHALEAATGYTTFLHGEAVSIGMMAAAYISHETGLLAEDDVARQRTALEGFGLPVSFEGADSSEIREAMRSDKKIAAGAVRWVLLDGIGNAVVRDDVPAEAVRHALERLGR